jgi:hypothetical protein
VIERRFQIERTDPRSEMQKVRAFTASTTNGRLDLVMSINIDQVAMTEVAFDLLHNLSTMPVRLATEQLIHILLEAGSYTGSAAYLVPRF